MRFHVKDAIYLACLFIYTFTSTLSIDADAILSTASVSVMNPASISTRDLRIHFHKRYFVTNCESSNNNNIIPLKLYQTLRRHNYVQNATEFRGLI